MNISDSLSPSGISFGVLMHYLGKESPISGALKDKFKGEENIEKIKMLTGEILGRKKEKVEVSDKGVLLLERDKIIKEYIDEVIKNLSILKQAGIGRDEYQVIEDSEFLYIRQNIKTLIELDKKYPSGDDSGKKLMESLYYYFAYQKQLGNTK